MLPEKYLIRPAGVQDFEVIAEHRAAMFRDMGLVTAEEHVLLLNACKQWISGQLENGRYVGWVIEFEKNIVAGAGVLLLESGPVPGCFRVGKSAHVVNVYTAPNHRRRGLARCLMNNLLDWCASHNIDHVTLAASDEGRSFYESLGFAPTTEMKLVRPLRK
jgi:GNAT superfamily N-acetyltransferase